jgi:hypothetical protein
MSCRTLAGLAGRARSVQGEVDNCKEIVRIPEILKRSPSRKLWSVAQGRPFVTGLYEPYCKSAALARKDTALLDGFATAVLAKSAVKAFACGSHSGNSAYQEHNGICYSGALPQYRSRFAGSHKLWTGATHPVLPRLVAHSKLLPQMTHSLWPLSSPRVPDRAGGASAALAFRLSGVPERRASPARRVQGLAAAPSGAHQ